MDHKQEHLTFLAIRGRVFLLVRLVILWFFFSLLTTSTAGTCADYPFAIQLPMCVNTQILAQIGQFRLRKQTQNFVCSDIILSWEKLAIGSQVLL